MANVLSLLFYMCFLWGRSLRFKNLRWHIRIMVAVMIADLSLVAALVVRRHALEKVALDMPWTLKLHVPIAIITVILYLFTAWGGFRLYRRRGVDSLSLNVISTDTPRLRARIRWLGRCLLVSRTLTLLTSLMVQFLKV